MSRRRPADSRTLIGLYFEPKKPSVAGSVAIDRYLASETKGRFIQSL